MWTSCVGWGEQALFCLPRGQESLPGEITFKLKTEHKSEMRRVEGTAFWMEPTARAKTLRRELLKSKHWREPWSVGAQGVDRMRA